MCVLIISYALYHLYYYYYLSSYTLLCLHHIFTLYYIHTILYINTIHLIIHYAGTPIALLVEDSAAYTEFIKLSEDDVSKLYTQSTLASKDTPTTPPSSTTTTTAAATAATSTVVTEISVGHNSDPSLPLRLSPAARHIIESQALIIQGTGLVGTSRGGRVSKADVVYALRAGLLKSSPPTTTTNKGHNSDLTPPTPTTPITTTTSNPTPTPTSLYTYTPPTTPVNLNYTDIPNTNMRKIIAKRLIESKKTVPHMYTTITCNIDNILHLRKELKNIYNINISVNDIIIKCVAMTLRDLAHVNNKWDSTRDTINRLDNHKVRVRSLIYIV